MKIKLQVVIEDDKGTVIDDVFIALDRGCTKTDFVGLTLEESKRILKNLQAVIVRNQAAEYVQAHRCCPNCQARRRIKGSTTIQYRTLFGIVTLPSQRLYHCKCEELTAKTFSPLNRWLSDHNCPQLQYLETKWASLMSYGLTVDLLKDVLPISEQLNAETVRQHLHRAAQRQDQELGDVPQCITGCVNDWGKLPKPDKPITMGIDGGYLRNWHQKNTNFEVIVGKSFSKTQTGKRLGFVQSFDECPQRRVMRVLNSQGMQANQQITFLSDGADNVRDLQYLMHPEAEHLLDWFHVSMRLTVLHQFAAGLIKTDPDSGGVVKKNLESAKWYLWHGNVENALDKFDDCYATCDDEDILYEKAKKFRRYLSEMYTYIRNNAQLIVNYGEKYRYGESISTGFVESTVNEVVAKRMVKKQQMQWTHKGAHYLLQTRTAVLNDELRENFERWYPEMKQPTPGNTDDNEFKMAA